MGQISDNKYAQLLREQGIYVITIEGVDWYEYEGFMLPAYFPHCFPDIKPEMAKEVLRISGRSFVRWYTRFGEVGKTEWWCVVKRGPWNLEGIKDRSKRYKIRKGRKNFLVRPLTEDEILVDCPRVTQLAASRYKTMTELETPVAFRKSVEASRQVPGVIEYLGCFYGGTLASFSENYIQANGVFCKIIRHDPTFLKENSSYALLDGMLDYYLNDKGFEYLSNGWRNVYHRTEFYDHIINVFGYTKEYSILNVVYARRFKVPLYCAYPFRDIIWFLDGKVRSVVLSKIAGLMRQEYIRRACRQ